VNNSGSKNRDRLKAALMDSRITRYGYKCNLIEAVCHLETHKDAQKIQQLKLA
jgi:hypothetical protein